MGLPLNLCSDFEKALFAAEWLEWEDGGIFEDEADGTGKPFGGGRVGGAGHVHLAEDPAELEFLALGQFYIQAAIEKECAAVFVFRGRHGFGDVDDERAGVVCPPGTVLDIFNQALGDGFLAFGIFF